MIMQTMGQTGQCVYLWTISPISRNWPLVHGWHMLMGEIGSEVSAYFTCKNLLSTIYNALTYMHTYIFFIRLMYYIDPLLNVVCRTLLSFM